MAAIIGVMILTIGIVCIKRSLAYSLGHIIQCASLHYCVFNFCTRLDALFWSELFILL